MWFGAPHPAGGRPSCAAPRSNFRAQHGCHCCAVLALGRPSLPHFVSSPESGLSKTHNRRADTCLISLHPVAGRCTIAGSLVVLNVHNGLDAGFRQGRCVFRKRQSWLCCTVLGAPHLCSVLMTRWPTLHARLALLGVCAANVRAFTKSLPSLATCRIVKCLPVAAVAICVPFTGKGNTRVPVLTPVRTPAT